MSEFTERLRELQFHEQHQVMLNALPAIIEALEAARRKHPGELREKQCEICEKLDALDALVEKP